MAQQIPAPVGVMFCIRCRTVKVFTAAQKLEGDAGFILDDCHGCNRIRTEFLPFNPLPSAVVSLPG